VSSNGHNDGIRVVLADDHPLILDGLRALIEAEPTMHVVGEATNGEDAVATVLAEEPDVVVIDVGMPGFDGVEATRRIVQDLPETRVIVLSGAGETEIAVQAVRAGAVGFLQKDAFETALLDGIRSAVEAPTASASAASDGAGTASASGTGEPSALSATDLRLLELVAEGYTNTQIARAMSVSVSTVKAHLSALFKKVGARDRASALAVCFRRGWIS